MSGGGGSTSTNTVSKADPWAGVQPYLTDLFGKAKAQQEGGQPAFYPGQTVSDPGAKTQTTNEAIYQRGMQGAPVTDVAASQLAATGSGEYLGGAYDPSSYLNMPTASGAMLNSNPWLDQTYQRAAGQAGEQFSKYTMPGIASMYSAAGRYGSGAMNQAMDTSQQNFGNTLSGLATQIYGGNYANERGLQQQAIGQMGQQYTSERDNMLRAAGLAPRIAATDYADLMAAQSVGGYEDTLAQQKLNADIQRWDFGQNKEAAKLNAYSSLLQGGLGFGEQNSQTTSPAPQKNRLAGAAGGAMAGSSFGPWGALAGGALGLFM